MTDRECVALLQWAAPRLGLRFRGFKNVRRQVCRRISARAAELSLDAAGYRQRLESDPDELRVLDGLCYVTISRFYRDRVLFDALRSNLLPALADLARRRGDPELRVWSAGCASGEEPYSVAMIWNDPIALRIIATDRDETVLVRARRGIYEAQTFRELPEDLQASGFEPHEGIHRVRDGLRRAITFQQEDVRTFAPDAPLHLVLCRNLAFTYFDEPAQQEFLRRVEERLVPGGLLVIGNHETLPQSLLQPHPRLPWVHVRQP